MLPNAACCSLFISSKQRMLLSRLPRYLTPGRSSLPLMAIHQPEPINPEDLHEATKELDAINAQMKLVEQRKMAVATPLGRASMPMNPVPALEGELGQGAMPMQGVNNSDNNQEERPAKWQRENFKGGHSQGKGKGHSGRGSQMVPAPQQTPQRQPAGRNLPSSHRGPGDVRDTRLLPSPRSNASSPCATPWHASS